MNAHHAPINGEVRKGDRSYFSRAEYLLAFGLAVLVLSWPAIVNRSPFFLPDTTAYLRSGDALVTTFSHRPTIWSDRMDFYQPQRESRSKAKQGAGHKTYDQSRATDPKPAKAAHPPLLGRSIYFGILIYLPAILLGELSAVFLSSGIIAYVVWLCLLPLRFPSSRRTKVVLVASCICLAVTTPVAFVSSTLMPDYLSGVLVVALILLASFWSRYSGWQRTFLALVVVLACLSHTSNLLLTAGLLIFVVVLLGLKFPLAKSALGIALVAVLAGFAGEMLFAKAVEAYAGIEPVRPPFLTARLVSDGPGYRFMQQECDRRKFAICQFRGAMPADSDEILWSIDRAHGAFSVADWPTQAKLGREDAQFARAVFTRDPLGVGGNSIASFCHQLILVDFDYINRVFGADRINTLPISVAKRMRRARSYRGEMVVKPFELTSAFMAALSLLGAVGMLIASRSNLRNPWIGALAIMLAGIAINAAISGALSKPDPRYTLKVLWILPLIAGFALYGWRFARETPALHNSAPGQ